MDQREGSPALHTPSVFRSLEDQTQWVYEVFGSFIDQYIYPCLSGENKQETVEGNFLHNTKRGYSDALKDFFILSLHWMMKNISFLMASLKH